MNDNESRRHQMFVRVRGFFAQRTGDFSETGAARQLINELTGLIGDLDSFGADQAAGIGQARQRTVTRGAARLALREDIEAINRTARLIGVESQFPLPTADNDQLLLNAARAFAGNAFPLSAQLIAHEMPANFLTDLNADINALEAAIAQQGDAVGDHVAAGAAIDETIDRGVEIVRKLKGIVQNKYANDPITLAEWTSASHTERAPRHAAAAGSSTTPPPGPPPSSDGTPPAG